MFTLEDERVQARSCAHGRSDHEDATLTLPKLVITSEISQVDSAAALMIRSWGRLRHLRAQAAQPFGASDGAHKPRCPKCLNDVRALRASGSQFPVRATFPPRGVHTRRVTSLTPRCQPTPLSLLPPPALLPFLRSFRPPLAPCLISPFALEKAGTCAAQPRTAPLKRWWSQPEAASSAQTGAFDHIRYMTDAYRALSARKLP